MNSTLDEIRRALVSLFERGEEASRNLPKVD